jgi:hypothetical protein
MLVMAPEKMVTLLSATVCSDRGSGSRQQRRRVLSGCLCCHNHAQVLLLHDTSSLSHVLPYCPTADLDVAEPRDEAEHGHQQHTTTCSTRGKQKTQVN